jgi:CotH kinase protein/Chitobiase/beta-hexosaminidase C-terminal domain/Lamin Tail Domain/Secretion system C-terminal sorting domain/Right handed beta helix region
MSKYFLIILCFIFLVSFSFDSSAVERIFIINSGEDDAEETISSGILNNYSTDLELGKDQTKQIVGLYFRNISIPKGSKINSAKIIFTVDEKSDGDASYFIKVENNPRPEPISGNFSLSKRSYFTPLSWNNVAQWAEINKEISSPDISSLVSQITSSQNWEENNNLLIAFEGEGRRTAFAFEGNPNKVAKLVINFSPINYVYLLSPLNNFITSENIILKWEGDYNGYEIYLGNNIDNPDDFNILDGEKTSKSEYQLNNLESGKKYFWQIIGKKSGEKDYVSEKWAFVVSNKSGKIVINELMASNLKSVPELNDYSDFPDWIEIKNSSNKFVDISSHGLSDDALDLQKWIFPENTYLSPNEHLILWADNLDKLPGKKEIRPWYPGDIAFTTKYYHLNFKLSKSGETVLLSDDNGEIIDSLTYQNQLTDVSFGRGKTGKQSEGWYFYTFPSPGSENNGLGVVEKKKLDSPEFLPESGMYQNNISVKLNSADADAYILYTTDGNYPTINSKTYSNPIEINENTVIHAIALKDGFLGSDIVSSAYLIGEKEEDVPIVHLYMNQKYLFSTDNGIYQNTLKEREIPVNMDIYDGNDTGRFSVGVRIGGENIFRFAQKPLNIYTDKDYGTEVIEQKIFPDSKRRKFDRIYLRNAGDDWANTFILDAFQREIFKNDFSNPTQNYTPSIVYINGEYFGIHNIREKVTSDFFIENYNAKEGQIDHLEVNGAVIEGDSTDFLKISEYIKNTENDLANSELYKLVEENIDVSSFIDFLIFQIYSVNTSWGHNREYWRNKAQENKWEWILVDLDRGFNMANVEMNYLQKMYDENSMFRSLLKNDKFKQQFIGRFQLYLNTIFTPTNINEIVDRMKKKIEALMPNHIKRWASSGGISSLAKWESNVEKLKQFGAERHPIMTQDLRDFFGLGKEISLEIKTNGNGYVLLSGKELKGLEEDDNSVLKFFATDKGININLEIIPDIGYKIKNINNNFIDLLLEKDTLINIVFERNSDLLLDSIVSSGTELILQKNKIYLATDDIVIEENANMKIEAGVVIKFPDNASIITHGSLKIMGTSDNPVKFILNEDRNARRPLTKAEAQDKLWGAVIADNATDTTFVNHLQMRGASHGENEILFQGAFSSNNSIIYIDGLNVVEADFPFFAQYGSVSVRNSSFYSRATCDYINIKYADYALVDKCNFIGNTAFDTDAIDFDNISSGTISNNIISNFQGFNSDGIDIGEGANNILIKNNFIYNCVDKGISIGQASSAIIENNVIMSCYQGIGIKDYNSFGNIINNTFYKNNISVACFEKNLGSGGGKATVTNTISDKVFIIDYFADELSEITINYSIAGDFLYDGVGNIMGDPQLTSPDLFDFSLKDDSPSIGSGNPDILGSDGLPLDMGAIDFRNDLDLDLIKELNIFINEVFTTKSSVDGQSDWIEIYNGGNSPVNIQNMFLSDDVATLSKFLILSSGDETVIGGKSFKIFWADNDETLGLDHTNFKLSSKGETVFLVQKDGITVQDKLQFPPLLEGQTFGRYPDGADSLSILFPTPNSINSFDDGNTQIDTLKTLSFFPNPVENTLYIKFNNIDFELFNIEIYDMNSRKVFSKLVSGNTTANLSRLAQGTYVIYVRTSNNIFISKFVKA